MTQLWSHRQGFRPPLTAEFWIAFHTVLKRLIEDQAESWVPYYESRNALFRRFNQPFELVEGKVHRRGSESLERPVERIEDLVIPDEQLRNYLLAAREAFFDARVDRRLDGLRSLWDAFERLKSLSDQDKKKSVANLIESLAPYPSLKEPVETIVRQLTDIGNKANIRHSEQRVEILNEDGVLIEYLFFSGFALIRAALQRQEEQAKAEGIDGASGE